MAMRIEQERVVTLSYRLLDRDGRLHDERTPENPYVYLHGRGAIVLPVEVFLEGKTPGFTGEVSLGPRDGFGEYDPSLVDEIPRDAFPVGAEIQVGMKFNTRDRDGRTVTVRVIAAESDVVTVDGNHPLAGLELLFELRVLDVRAATREEIEAGRVDVQPMPPGSDFGSLH